jgi:deoxyadenosine/deoxycytidine kinase
MHIAIVGNIGAGKTTLTEMLAKNYGWEPLLKRLTITPTWKIFTTK